MKFFIIIIVFFAAFSCATNSKNSTHSRIAKQIIVRTDTLREHYVFSTIKSNGDSDIVLAERDTMKNCMPFKKYIIQDSITTTTFLKSGSKYDIVGLYLKSINDVKIRKDDELIKIIWNCNCFTDK